MLQGDHIKGIIVSAQDEGLLLQHVQGYVAVQQVRSALWLLLHELTSTGSRWQYSGVQ